MARHGGAAIGAFGKPAFVVGALVVGVISNAVVAHEDFDDCMLASGWTINDEPINPAPQNVGQTARVAAPIIPVVALQPMPVSAPAHLPLPVIASQMRACIVGSRQLPDYAPVLPHLMDLDLGSYTPAQIADENRPNAREARLVEQQGAENDACVDHAVAQISSINPVVAATIEQQSRASRAVRAALAQRAISWGEWARRSQDLVDTWRPRLQATAN